MSTTPRGQIVGYVRVSTSDQNPARQLEALGEVDRVFEDRLSGGSRKDRTGLQACIDYVRAGDEVRVASMDRLARSVIDLQQIVEEVLAKGASVRFLQEQQHYEPHTSNPWSVYVLQTLGSFAELERNLIRERQREGIALAKAVGKYKGGRGRSLTDEQLATAREKIAQGVPKARIARELGVDRSTLYRALNRRI